MKREFVVEEIFVDRVSGEARGTVVVDSFTGLVDDVEYTEFSFFHHRSHDPVTLTGDQQQRVEKIVEQVFESDAAFTEGVGLFCASAESLNLETNAAHSASKRTLAGFLANVARQIRAGINRSAGRETIDSGVKRFG